MAHLVLRVLGMIGLLFALVSPPADAQEPPVRVRGTIDRVEGDVYIVKARGGGELKVKLAEKATVVALDFQRKHEGQAFTAVVAGNAQVAAFGQIAALDVIVDHAR